MLTLATPLVQDAVEHVATVRAAHAYTLANVYSTVDGGKGMDKVGRPRSDLDQHTNSTKRRV